MARRSPTSVRTQVLRPSGALSFESVHSPVSRSAICPGRFSLTSRSFRQTDNPSRFSRGTGNSRRSLSGGNPVTLADKINAAADYIRRVARFRHDRLRWAGTAGLKQVPADGGSPTTLTSVDVAQGEWTLPGVLCARGGRGGLHHGVQSARSPRLEAVILQSGERRVITENASGGRYLSTGHLAFTRGDAVLVAPMTMKRLALVGRRRRSPTTSDGTVRTGRDRPAADGVVERHARVCPESRRHGARDGTCRPRRSIHALRTGRWSEPAATRLARRSAWRSNRPGLAVMRRSKAPCTCTIVVAAP